MSNPSLSTFQQICQKTEMDMESSETGEMEKMVRSSNAIPRRSVDENSKAFPLRNDSHQWVALNIGHQQQKCQFPAGALRILGFFSTKEEITTVFKGSDLDVYAFPVFTWMQITKAPVPPENATAAQEKIVKRVMDYLEKSKADVDNIAEERDVPIEERHQRSMDSIKTMQQLDDVFAQNKKATNTTIPSYPRDKELRGQNWTVVSIITDPDPNDEPLVHFYYGFDSQSDANDYNRNTLHSNDVKMDSFVVQMYEWVVPLATKTWTFKEKIPASYTHTDLEDLFRGQKWEQQKIESLLKAAEKNKKQKEAENNAVGKNTAEV